jgi:hypothetical protein
MYYYVKIKRLNGRKDHIALAEWANSSGVGAADYNEGGWSDQMIHNVAAHLRFDKEGDAIAYVLAHGGRVLMSIPEMIPGVDFLPGG